VVDWNKGKAVEFLLESLGKNLSSAFDYILNTNQAQNGVLQDLMIVRMCFPSTLEMIKLMKMHSRY